MKSVTTMRSRTRERTGMVEIGQLSDGISGTKIFATGRIDTDFHWLGTTEDDSDKFIILEIGAAKNGAPTRLEIGAAKNGAPTRKNHAGI